MKYLKQFEDYSREQIEDMLNRAKKDSIIDKDVDINKVIDKLHDRPKLGTFEEFVDSEANFISHGNRENMAEFIQKFKQMGLDTKKAEELYPKLKRDLELMNEIDGLRFGGFNSEEERNKKEEELYQEEDDLREYVKELELEIKKLAKQAKIKLYQ